MVKSKRRESNICNLFTLFEVALFNTTNKIEVTTKMNFSFFFFILSNVFGVLIFSNRNIEASEANDLYVLGDNNKPIKLDLTDHGVRSLLPYSNLSNYVSFLLYTRHTRNSPDELYVDDVNVLRRSHFDPKKSTKFVTHGWMSSCQKEVCTSIRDAFLVNGDYNVITIDWGTISNNPYVFATAFTVRIGKYVARMFDFLVSQGLHASNVTIVGHSMGAHIAGLASYYAKDKAYYVVGLDPAGPLYSIRGIDSRLNKGDAEYVEVIHTTEKIGDYNPIGDSDFYPNGGFVQNGCGIDLGEGCSHARSYMYYAESINSDRFVARKCSNYFDYVIGKCNSSSVAHMGGVTPDFSVKGKYYLYTNPQSPYAKG